MKLGFVSAILAELALEDVVTFAGESGFGVIELMCWPAGKRSAVTPESLTSMSRPWPTPM
jgi:hypothetical protein